MSIKKIIGIFLVIGVLIYSLSAIEPKKTALFFIPHQDDETLTFSPAIQRYIKDGYDVHVILSTDGISSSVREDLLNGSSVCNIHNERHNLEISQTEFTKLRDIEYTQALIDLGVKQKNIHISRFAVKDGTLDKDRAKTIISDYVEQYPNSKVFTMSNTSQNVYGGHNDHYTLGMAAKELYDEGKINDLDLFVEFYIRENFEKKNKNIKLEKYYPTNSNQIKRATYSYTNFDPKHQHYAIGDHSVSQLFSQVKQDLYNDKFVSYYYNIKR
ncbi:PIG-L family deacetylase [Paraclostridium ghonii]|uniref:LmbE family N-acetylglucosaminyl deacetylase n=1 Tax=Paraclostridium ghonii TaxID=29358 RepID=A0ABU0MVJ1_9FIRM|nr:PIG-L family deacetylase [Paeniclostridium ghonii]MDQ0554902.1 LmbE family N-acetylglucosaminyl deacetylase [Paeniclostridium ghonii]